MHMLRSVILTTATLVLAAQTPAPEAPKTTSATATAAKPGPSAKAAKAAPAAKAAKAADPILATIGKEVIRLSDFELFMATTMTDQQRMQLQFVDGAREQYLTRFLEFKALAAKARREGFQKQPDHAKKLAIMDMQLLIQALMERDGPALQAKLDLKDTEVKAFFDAHPDKFKSPETFTARHILIGTRANGDQKALTDEEAKAKADKVLAEIKGGKTFDAAAKEYSDDPGSKDKGGLYEDTAFGKFVPEFDQAVRSQAIGKVGDPVKTMYGYHLIEVEKITPAVAQTFEAAKDSAKEQAVAERQEAVMQAYMDKVKKEVGFKSAGAKAQAQAQTQAAQ
jgi:peptidyl-prolyl cis-trans isomerase C